MRRQHHQQTLTPLFRAASLFIADDAAAIIFAATALMLSRFDAADAAIR